MPTHEVEAVRLWSFFTQWDFIYSGLYFICLCFYVKYMRTEYREVKLLGLKVYCQEYMNIAW